MNCKKSLVTEKLLMAASALSLRPTYKASAFSGVNPVLLIFFI